jgi:cytidine deaminase
MRAQSALMLSSNSGKRTPAAVAAVLRSWEDRFQSSANKCGTVQSADRGRIVHGYCSRVDERALAATVSSCKDLIDSRFPDDGDHGGAAMLLGDGTILTGTAPDAVNASVEVCHEIEPYCGAYRLNQRVVASVCLHRQPGGRTVVLSPCGVCRERLAVYGPGVLVAVADRSDPTIVVWKTLRDVLPDYWMTAFPDEIDAGWTT